MLKKYWTKVVKWHNKREPQDYYDPFSGIVMLAKKKSEKNGIN
jgi:hypothetical protein